MKGVNKAKQPFDSDSNWSNEALRTRHVPDSLKRCGRLRDR